MQRIPLPLPRNSAAFQQGYVIIRQKRILQFRGGQEIHMQPGAAIAGNGIGKSILLFWLEILLVGNAAQAFKPGVAFAACKGGIGFAGRYQSACIRDLLCTHVHSAQNSAISKYVWCRRFEGFE